MGLDLARVIAQLANAGLDLVHAFDAHALAGAAADSRAAVFGSSDALARWSRLAEGPRLGLLVGNTRALWPHFVAARSSLPAKDPLDTYVEQTLARVLADNALDALGTSDASDSRTTNHAPGTHDANARVLTRVWFAHRAYNGAFLPFQRLAVATGFGAMTEGRLVVHPIYGPWFALRAVITLDVAILPFSVNAPDAPMSPIAKPCECTAACSRALEAALADTNNWRAWLAVRDACSLRAWRYSDEQIRFHYANAWPDAGRE